jgi:hypothetical protein
VNKVVKDVVVPLKENMEETKKRNIRGETIYHIEGNYYEKDRVTKEVFRDIHNATIISESLVENSFNKVKGERDEETAKALIDVAKFIEKSGKASAGALFDKFNEIKFSQKNQSLVIFGME